MYAHFVWQNAPFLSRAGTNTNPRELPPCPEPGRSSGLWLSPAVEMGEVRVLCPLLQVRSGKGRLWALPTAQGQPHPPGSSHPHTCLLDQSRHHRQDGSGLYLKTGVGSGSVGLCPPFSVFSISSTTQGGRPLRTAESPRGCWKFTLLRVWVLLTGFALVAEVSGFCSLNCTSPVSGTKCVSRSASAVPGHQPWRVGAS